MGRTGGLAAWRGVLSFGQWLRGKGSRETREGCGIFGQLGWFLPLVFLVLFGCAGVRFMLYIRNCWRFTDEKKDDVKALFNFLIPFLCGFAYGAPIL